MTKVTNPLHWLLPLAMMLLGGCASAYHSYSDCSVDCKYCVPAPLPHANYQDGVCHSDTISPYLPLQPQSVQIDVETDAIYQAQ